jgi:hypothetical protein
MDSRNYFNYFTEIEEYFWKKRGAHLLVSPLDWAIMETWQQAGVPLEAVLKGIDAAFESYSRSRRGANRPLKSLAYCADAVLQATEDAKEASAGKSQGASAKKPSGFERHDLKTYVERNIAMLRSAAEREDDRPELASLWQQAIARLESLKSLLDAPASLDMEDIERQLTVLDETIHAGLLLHAGQELLLRLRREMDGALAAYRRSMKAAQLALVEKQYLQKRLLEEFRVPRLSLFYLA